MFSATFQDVQEYINEFLRPSYFNVFIGGENKVADTVQQRLFMVSGNVKKLEKLYEILLTLRINSYKDQDGLMKKTIVFCNEKRRTNWVAVRLTQRGIKTTRSNGDLSQIQRQRAIDEFVNSDCDVIVATNVLGRGLNFENVDQVINYDLPQDFEDYIHRSGRTGRMGNTGVAYSFFDPIDSEHQKKARDIATQLHKAGQEFPMFLRDFL